MQLLEGQTIHKAIDLGSDDGRIVITLTERGIKADGYEINPLLVMQSRHQIRKKAYRTELTSTVAISGTLIYPLMIRSFFSV